MRKQNLFELTAEVRKIIGELPVIVGSQAIFAITDYPPEIVQKSVECDFLLLNDFAKLRPKLDKKLGIFSGHQEETGFYADVLGRATVVLPFDWEKRLVKLKDENGNVIAFCVEIHDIAISKLMAGREKDFKFLQNVFESNYLQIETFLERAKMIMQHPSANALRPRFLKLIESFEKTRNLHAIVRKLKIFIQNFENNKQ